MDTKLKQRLIGGAVLIALAIIFLPMLVQGPAPDSGVGDVSTRVPATPAGKFETRELPLGPAAGQAGLPAPAAAPAPAPEPAAASAATPGPAQEPATAEPAGPAAAKPDPAVAAGEWAVSFGAYASARDADAVLSRLRQAGLEGFKEQTELNGRQAWRVRVGPYPDRAMAEAGRLQAVRIRNDVNAQVIALDAGAGAATAAVAAGSAAKPAASAPVPAPRAEPEKAASPPAKPPAAAVTAPPKSSQAPSAAPVAPAASNVGFAVQMGAFASEAEALALRDRLRAAGYSAIVQPVRTDKGTLNRVRVGPVASRAEAEQLKARLGGGFGNGMVVQHP